MSERKGWIGVDLDGTLAHYESWNRGEIGAPVSAMVQRVKDWLAMGAEVRIFTARVAGLFQNADMPLYYEAVERRHKIIEWCKVQFGRELPVTALKDYDMVELWDDRAVQVVRNEGRPIGRT
jgi:hypothetical protein